MPAGEARNACGGGDRCLRHSRVGLRQGELGGAWGPPRGGGARQRRALRAECVFPLFVGPTCRTSRRRSDLWGPCCALTVSPPVSNFQRRGARARRQKVARRAPRCRVEVRRLAEVQKLLRRSLLVVLSELLLGRRRGLRFSALPTTQGVRRRCREAAGCAGCSARRQLREQSSCTALHARNCRCEPARAHHSDSAERNCCSSSPLNPVPRESDGCKLSRKTARRDVRLVTHHQLRRERAECPSPESRASGRDALSGENTQRTHLPHVKIISCNSARSPRSH